ncbi:TSSK6-activating co-chaperone protein [Erinaceus europaeus]|uniref:TSSK6-activating co-chaperone protein n=1 Tax=Erinaceus europaeus TaxID=9365 RepID=A0ABM3Y950_ERIEU|nr:TSSK6-activating co-chaperone protein [Erinaceus europaeus]
MARGEQWRLRNRAAAPDRVRLAPRRKRPGSGSRLGITAHVHELLGRAVGLRVSVNTAGTTFVGVQMEQLTSHPTNRKVKRETKAIPLCRAKPSPSFTNLRASPPSWTFLNKQTAKFPTGAGCKPKECLGLLHCMHTNLQLQNKLAQQQMAILEDLQASVTQVTPGKKTKNSALPASSHNPFLRHLLRLSK